MSEDQNSPQPADNHEVSHEDDPLAQLAGLEQAFLQLQVELKERSRLESLGMMAAALSHELRNVLTPAFSYAQMARSNPQDEKLVKKALDRITVGIETATELLDSTLNFACAQDAGDAPASSNITDTWHNAIEQIHDDLTNSVKLQADGAVSLHTTMATRSMQQVFHNLILNAIRAMDSTAPSNANTESTSHCITMRAIHLHDLGIARIEVCDNGPGLPEEVASSVFEPFVTMHGSDDGTKRGRGLGLAICQHLVEEAGGRIFAESSPGKGATFVIELPVSDVSLRKAG